MGRAAYAIEIPSGYLLQEVGLCAFVVYGRDGALDQQGLLHIGKMQHDLAARLCTLAGFDGIAHHLVGEGLGEFRVEIYLVIVGPSPCAATGAEGVGVNGLEIHLVGSLVLDGVIEVENHTCLFAFGIGEAIDGGALGGSDFCLHTIAVEQHAVVAWLGLFFALAKWRGIGHALCIGFFLADILDVGLAHDGHE